MREVGSHRPPEGWAGRVAFGGGATDRFAYVPREVVVAGRRGVEIARRLYDDRVGSPEQVFSERDENGPAQFFLLRLADGLDPFSVIHPLRLEGVVAQPNHVLFAHGDCGCWCPPHPAFRWQCGLPASALQPAPAPASASPVYGSSVDASPVYGSPVYGSPVYGSPVYGSPVYGSPVYGSPVYGSPVYGSASQQTGWRRSSARPAIEPSSPARTAPPGAAKPRVVILDTGLAIDGLRPNRLDVVDHPAPVADWGDSPDPDDDDSLDPAAGHGTFIAGLIEMLTPGCEVFVERVLTSYGDGDEVAIAQRIDALPDVDLLNLSFGGYALEHMDVLAAAVRRAQQRGTVVVASAGNDGTCRPSYPARFDDVVSVAALGPSGPALFSNYGPWIRACAPGVDLVSDFFTDVEGTDPDEFAGWACWSGTSFAAPVVVAALAREIQCYGLTPQQAVDRVIDGPGLLRIPDFGTVVNLVP